MLKRKFEPEKFYNVVLYLRMSSDKQNPRSPDQQEAEIRQRLQSLGYPWQIVKVYRDDGKSGRYLHNRPGFQQMLQDIRSGTAPVDLILVDTLERFGRIEELPVIRKELWEKHGVLILTADSGFADPTSPQGKAFGAFEAMRATEENRIKAYQVLRGKRDAARQGFWPGGPRPFGYRLVTRFSEVDGRQVPQGSVLEPHPEEAPIIRLLFQRAHETGHGRTRLARFLNDHPDISDKFKPFYDSTVGYWLEQNIYIGELVWEKLSTDVIDDARVIERNADEDFLCVPNFCEPLISREVWEAVQALRRQRSERAKQSRTKAKNNNGQKQIQPLAPGTSLIYPLSGLVRCGECQASMRPVTSGRTSKTGKKYAYYACPRAIVGNCQNKKHVSEDWLWQIVVEQIKKSLFS